MSDRPNLEARRTRKPVEIKPPHDEHVDPIETPAARATEPAPKAQPKASAQAETTPRALNIQVSEEVAQTIDFAKFKTKLSKRALVEQAVLAHWSKYKPDQD
jgi:hypothetical protein